MSTWTASLTLAGVGFLVSCATTGSSETNSPLKDNKPKIEEQKLSGKKI